MTIPQEIPSEGPMFIAIVGQDGDPIFSIDSGLDATDHPHFTGRQMASFTSVEQAINSLRDTIRSIEQFRDDVLGCGIASV